MLREIACDESGSEGEKLVGGNTDVFAHAGVDLRHEAAAECVRETRERIGSPATEYKANHLLREKNRWVLKWLLDPSGPIYGRAHVYLIDKTFYLIDRMVGVLLGDEHAAGVLYRDGPAAFGVDGWNAFLEAANDLLRLNHRLPAATPVVESFFALLGTFSTPGPLSEIMARLSGSRPEAEDFRVRRRADPSMLPPLDALIPAVGRAVDYWSGNTDDVFIVHDEQPALTARRVAQLQKSHGRLAGLRLVDSQSDFRVQVADFLAGVARKIASNELNDRGDPELTELLRPFVDTESIWVHQRQPDAEFGAGR